MNMLAKTGEGALIRIRRVVHLSALLLAVLCRAVLPRTWSRPVRNVLARQILFTCIEAVPFVSLIACMAGIAIVVQVQFWLNRVGQSSLLGPMLAAIVIREAAPLVANFIIIGRSGAAISAELGNMKVGGEVRVLDSQGLDPFLYLVVPRVLGTAISVFTLAVIFVFLSLAGGFFCGVLVGANTGVPSVFADSVFGAISREDIFNLLAKTLLPGLLTGAICCVEGLGVGAAVTEVPQAATRALVRSVTALFVITAFVSLLTYL
jgi:phospholipid/cholesterol/gamma-HCH transport system permease protein